MADNASSIQSIVDTNCGTLLKDMQSGHPGAGVGISVALFYPGNSAVPGFFSYGSAGPNTAITADTVYAIGSVTKVFTASLAAWLSVQKVIGALGQTAIAPYLKNGTCTPPGVSGPYWDGTAVPTFLQFATQTSGLPDEANGPYSVQLFADEPPSCDQLAWWNDRRHQARFERDFGTWIYSSAGFVTLGLAVAYAAATGGYENGYTGLLETVITGPGAVNMPNTFAADDIPPNAVLAQGYNHKGEVPITGAADLKSTATDMLAWLSAVYQAMSLQAGGGTMTPLQQALAAAAQVWIPHPVKPDKTPTEFAMGLGWQIPTIDSAQVLIKNGATSKGGCSCWVGLTRFSPTVPAVGIALMTNQIGVGPDATARTILRQIIALGSPPAG